MKNFQVLLLYNDLNFMNEMENAYAFTLINWKQFRSNPCLAKKSKISIEYAQNNLQKYLTNFYTSN